MSAKLVAEKAEIELTGGAELKFGNWVITIEDDANMVLECGDMEYTVWAGSNGWIRAKQDFGERVCTIYNLPEGKTNLLHRGLETIG